MTANDYYFHATKDRYIQFNQPYKDKFAAKLNQAIAKAVRDEVTKQKQRYIDETISELQIYFNNNPIKIAL